MESRGRAFCAGSPGACWLHLDSGLGPIVTGFWIEGSFAERRRQGGTCVARWAPWGDLARAVCTCNTKAIWVWNIRKSLIPSSASAAPASLLRARYRGNIMSLICFYSPQTNSKRLFYFFCPRRHIAMRVFRLMPVSFEKAFSVVTKKSLRWNE